MTTVFNIFICVMPNEIYLQWYFLAYMFMPCGVFAFVLNPYPPKQPGWMELFLLCLQWWVSTRMFSSSQFQAFVLVCFQNCNHIKMQLAFLPKLKKNFSSPQVISLSFSILPQASWRQMRGGPGGAWRIHWTWMPRGSTEAMSARINKSHQWVQLRGVKRGRMVGTKENCKRVLSIGMVIPKYLRGFFEKMLRWFVCSPRGSWGCGCPRGQYGGGLGKDWSKGSVQKYC